jgi:hypothetical protein
MMGSRILAPMVAASLWLAGVPVVAATAAPGTSDVKVAILPLSVEGEISASDRSDLTNALVTGFQRGDFEVLAPDRTDSMSPEAAGCMNAGCVKAVAKATGSRFIARPLVKVNDRDYAISVELLDGESGQRIAVSNDSCEICGVIDASGLLDSAAASLGLKLAAMAKGPATLVMTTEPDGASIYLDGKLLGTAPLDRPITPGKHTLRVVKDGFIPTEREVTFVEGVREELRFALDKMPSALPGRAVGAASLGVGVVALGGAAFLTWLHDQPYKIGGACADPAAPNVMTGPDGSDICRELWNTKWGALSAGVAGAALTTLGVLVLIDTFKRSDRGRRKATSGKASARVGVGPGSVLIQGRF